MYTLMKKIPGGLLLIPMLVSALFCTFLPHFFEIGGATEALFTSKGLNYIIGFACLCSGVSLDIRQVSTVLKKEGMLILVKALLNIGLGLLFIHIFGMRGVFGISAIAYIVTICSTNPSLFLALEEDYGSQNDMAAFGLIGILCTPAYPLLVFSLSQATTINWTPIISTLIPVLIGVVIGNIDTKMKDFLAPGAALSLPFMGFAFGANINLIDAIQAGPQGFLLTLLYYIPMVLLMVGFERYLLKKRWRNFYCHVLYCRHVCFSSRPHWANSTGLSAPRRAGNCSNCFWCCDLINIDSYLSPKTLQIIPII